LKRSARQVSSIINIIIVIITIALEKKIEVSHSSLFSPFSLFCVFCAQFFLPAGRKEELDPWYIYTHAVFVMPPLFVATLAALFITTTPLPAGRTNVVNKIFSFLRTFQMTYDAEEGRSLYKANQFMKGSAQLNFNLVAIVFIVIPCVVQFIGYVQESLSSPEYDTLEKRWFYVALMFGWSGTIALGFFLIPVTRHSVLLVALGWSPVHALRIHVVTGWFAWWCIVLHGAMYVVEWFAFRDSVVDAIFPANKCWTFRDPASAFAGGKDEFYDRCSYQFFNVTGIFAGSFFLVLAASSIHWFRRRNYRLFYMLHVIFGTLLLIATMFHWPGATVILMPSLIYYLASTSPTLVQALASYRRGGHKIVKVIDLGGSNGENCIEVHVETDAMTDAALTREPCSYIKLCVPSISMVWHPFTVFRYSKDPKTVRILFRPAGPFTTQLAQKLVATPRPIVILDGLYSVGNHAIHAMTHDHVLIVTGGVAITPFLSLIPNLLDSLQ
jgi:Ferric reductase like transmembrane component/FAD-binding domain